MGTYHRPHLRGLVQTQMGTPSSVRHQGPTTTTEGGMEKSDWHLHVWTCQSSKSTDPNADITHTLWRFDVQGWLDQYQEESMMPHIYNSLRGYPGRWVCSLDRGQNLTVTELLQQMDHAFGNMPEYDTMICSLSEIWQKEGESVKEYML